MKYRVESKLVKFEDDFEILDIIVALELFELEHPEYLAVDNVREFKQILKEIKTIKRVGE